MSTTSAPNSGPGPRAARLAPLIAAIVAIPLLAVALVGCLFWHPALTPQGLTLVPHEPLTTAPAVSPAATGDANGVATGAAPVPVAASVEGTGQGAAAPATANNAASAAADAAAPVAQSTLPPAEAAAQLEDAMSDLRVMQSNLLVMQQELNLLYPGVAPASTPAAATLDLPAMLAELDRLNQVMLPLMAQIDSAVQAGRPETEIAAMRSQMEQIHQRLEELIAAIEADRTQP